MIGTYEKSIIQHQIGRYILQRDFIHACMEMIYPVTGWFVIVKVPKFELNEAAAGNDEYIDK